jgi:hypothetical protein
MVPIVQMHCDQRASFPFLAFASLLSRNPKRAMKLHRIGAVSSFLLTLQFAATLGLIAAAWNLGDGSMGRGLDRLAFRMATYVAPHAQDPATFLLLNLYNASFFVTVLPAAFATRQRLAEAELRMQGAMITVSIAAGLFLTSGIIPVVAVPDMVSTSDSSAVAVLPAVVVGMVLAATSAIGFTVVFCGWAGLTTGKLPAGLCVLAMVGGVMEITEFAVPAFLILEPLIGVFWSLWLGIVFLRSD